MLFLTALHAARHAFVLACVVDITAVKHHEVRPVAHRLRVGYGARTAAKRQVIHCVEQVCLALAVVSYKTIQLGGKGKFSLFNVLVIDNR